MAKMIKKANLPSKICAACGLPFAGLKKRARDWCDPRTGTAATSVQHGAFIA